MCLNGTQLLLKAIICPSALQLHVWLICHLNSQPSPNAWKSAVVVPIFKTGEPTEVKNYKPISILPVVSKIAEKVVAEELTAFLNSGQDSLHPMQFGFRKNHSTEMATCYLFEKIKTNIDSGSAVGAVFLDLSKAFDTVNHSVLLSKVSNFNLSVET